MIEEIYTSLKLFSIVWVITSQLEFLLEKIGFEVLNPYLCNKCISFWIGLIFFDLWIGAIAAIMSVAFDSKFSETKL